MIVPKLLPVMVFTIVITIYVAVRKETNKSQATGRAVAELRKEGAACDDSPESTRKGKESVL